MAILQPTSPQVNQDLTRRELVLPSLQGQCDSQHSAMLVITNCWRNLVERRAPSRGLLTHRIASS